MNEPNKQPTADPLHDIVLLPCPFCGSAGRFFDRHDDYNRIIGFDVGCTNSDCIAGCGFDWILQPIELIMKWNTRECPQH